MASTFITYSYQINFESVLMIHDNEGMVNMFKALEASGLRRFLGCESTLYESELGHFFDTASIQDEDITCTISGKFITISPSLFTTVFALPSEGITNFSEVPKDKVYDARSLFSQKVVQSPSSLPAIDYIDRSGVRLAHFYSIAKSTCWVRPVMLMNGVWTPVQGPDFWRSSCHLSLFLNNMQMPAPAIQAIFVPNVSFIEPILYCTTVSWIIRTWQWTKVCEEVVKFSLSGGLRPVREDVCQDITVYNLGVERIPVDFLRIFAQGLSCHSFVDSVVQRDLGDIEEVVLTDVEEVDLVSSDVSTVYRSPSPLSPGVDSLEHDLCFALGPAIFSRVEQEERLYFVQSPESPPAVSPHHASSSSSAAVSLHFDSTDVPVHAQADPQAPASVEFTKFTEALEDLRSSLAQRIDDSNCEMLSKLNAVEVGVRGDILKVQSLLCQSFETVCRVLERQSNTQTAQITDLKKGLMAPVGTIFGDLFDIKKKQREKDARLIKMDEQIAAITNEHLDFQSKIAADILSLSTQVGDIAEFLIGGAAKKGKWEVAAAQLPFRKQLAQHDIVCINGFDDVSHSRHHDVIIIFSYNAPNRYDDISSTEVGKWIDMMTSSVLKLAKLLNLVYRDKSLDSKEVFIHLLQEEICR
ncbi:root phototropism protein 3-like [Dorcoceras hygrometricum]|uniref:Root phototropism protein 3-like n=1 Tax=Dorcoceras hygrometricum TaxID=472368 RepID=A0A2Z7D3D5_9LAMI|nr:root phototropism protein 3-like [Dorcoceras hygrometricum]